MGRGCYGVTGASDVALRGRTDRCAMSCLSEVSLQFLGRGCYRVTGAAALRARTDLPASV